MIWEFILRIFFKFRRDILIVAVYYRIQYNITIALKKILKKFSNL